MLKKQIIYFDNYDNFSTINSRNLISLIHLNKVRKFYVLYRDLESNLIYLFLNEEYSEKKFSIFTHVRNAKLEN